MKESARSEVTRAGNSGNRNFRALSELGTDNGGIQGVAELNFLVKHKVGRPAKKEEFSEYEREKLVEMVEGEAERRAERAGHRAPEKVYKSRLEEIQAKYASEHWAP